MVRKKLAFGCIQKTNAIPLRLGFSINVVAEDLTMNILKIFPKKTDLPEKIDDAHLHRHGTLGLYYFISGDKNFDITDLLKFKLADLMQNCTQVSVFLHLGTSRNYETLWVIDGVRAEPRLV